MKNKILNLIESKEVRDCVSENFDKLSKKQIIDIIYGSPYSLQQKYDIMNQLAEQEKDCGEISYTEYAKKLNTELSHLELQENEIFVLELYLHADFFYLCDTIYSEPFNSFDKVIEHIHNETLPVNSDWCWYKLSKWSLDDEKNKYIIEYYISTEGEVFFSDYYKKFKYQVFFPLPFNVGDIICFDSLPFTNEMLGIILVADNHIDRIHTKCLCFDVYGNIYVESLEDFSVWKYHAYGFSLPSPLYRTTIFNGELTDHDKNLLTIKEVLTKDKNAAQKICDFVSVFNKDKKFSDLKWETLYREVIR